ATSRTATPLAASSCAVPPVERISMLRPASSRASSTRPVLSETERSARRTGGGIPVSGAGLYEPLEVLLQGAANDADDPGGAGLVALGVIEEHGKLRHVELR